MKELLQIIKEENNKLSFSFIFIFKEYNIYLDKF